MYPILARNNQIVGFSKIAPPTYTGEEIPIGFDIRETDEEAAFYENGEFIRRNIFDLNIYKQKQLQYISALCYSSAEEILPKSKQVNILLGATAGYPIYLQGDLGKQNVALFIELYKDIYRVAYEKINDAACDTKLKVQLIIGEITYPTSEEILTKIKLNSAE